MHILVWLVHVETKIICCCFTLVHCIPGSVKIDCACLCCSQCVCVCMHARMCTCACVRACVCVHVYKTAVYYWLSQSIPLGFQAMNEIQDCSFNKNVSTNLHLRKEKVHPLLRRYIKCFTKVDNGMPPPTPTCLPVYPATSAPKPLPHKCEQQTSQHPCPTCVNTEIANTANTPVLPV